MRAFEIECGTVRGLTEASSIAEAFTKCVLNAGVVQFALLCRWRPAKKYKTGRLYRDFTCPWRYQTPESIIARKRPKR